MAVQLPDPADAATQTSVNEAVESIDKAGLRAALEKLSNLTKLTAEQQDALAGVIDQLETLTKRKGCHSTQAEVFLHLDGLFHPPSGCMRKNCRVTKRAGAPICQPKPGLTADRSTRLITAMQKYENKNVQRFLADIRRTDVLILAMLRPSRNKQKDTERRLPKRRPMPCQRIELVEEFGGQLRPQNKSRWKRKKVLEMQLAPKWGESLPAAHAEAPNLALRAIKKSLSNAVARSRRRQSRRHPLCSY